MNDERMIVAEITCREKCMRVNASKKRKMSTAKLKAKTWSTKVNEIGDGELDAERT